MTNSFTIRAASVLAMALALGASHAQAQSAETPSPVVPDRSYKLLSEDEDWSFLRDASLRQDFWDLIKYIPIKDIVTRINVDNTLLVLTIGPKPQP